MKFRLRAFGLHLAGSAAALTLVVGTLYLGWYRWPGWYLADVGSVAGVLAGVDLALGPLLTLVIANPTKPRRELARDISVIVLVQALALAYGAHTLWHGRPLYYTFSADRIEVVRSSDIADADAEDGRRLVPELAPHWYSLPRWVWARLPDDPKAAAAIVNSQIGGGADVIDMPRYYRPWSAAGAAIRAQLMTMDKMRTIGESDRRRLRPRLRAAGFREDDPRVLLCAGRGLPLLAVIDPSTGRILSIP